MGNASRRSKVPRCRPTSLGHRVRSRAEIHSPTAQILHAALEPIQAKTKPHLVELGLFLGADDGDRTRACAGELGQGDGGDRHLDGQFRGIDPLAQDADVGVEQTWAYSARIGVARLLLGRGVLTGPEGPQGHVRRGAGHGGELRARNEPPTPTKRDELPDPMPAPSHRERLAALDGVHDLFGPAPQVALRDLGLN